MLSNYDSISNKILVLRQKLREILEEDIYKDCLIILSGVQNYKIIKEFDLRCKILIITRNKEVIYVCILFLLIILLIKFICFIFL